MLPGCKGIQITQLHHVSIYLNLIKVLYTSKVKKNYSIKFCTLSENSAYISDEKWK